jgi:hypothetical protein
MFRSQALNSVPEKEHLEPNSIEVVLKFLLFVMECPVKPERTQVDARTATLEGVVVHGVKHYAEKISFSVRYEEDDTNPEPDSKSFKAQAGLRVSGTYRWQGLREEPS